MNPCEILKRTLESGVTISTNEAGKIKVEGDQHAVENWLPMITEHKQALLRLIQTEKAFPSITPAPCKDCNRFEFVKIMGAEVPGCLYQITAGEWTEGWKRLSIDMEKCVMA